MNLGEWGCWYVTSCGATTYGAVYKALENLWDKDENTCAFPCFKYIPILPHWYMDNLLGRTFLKNVQNMRLSPRFSTISRLCGVMRCKHSIKWWVSYGGWSVGCYVKYQQWKCFVIRFACIERKEYLLLV